MLDAGNAPARRGYEPEEVFLPLFKITQAPLSCTYNRRRLLKDIKRNYIEPINDLESKHQRYKSF
jgi:hypothetical protein